MQVIVSAHVAKRPTTQPNQNARNKDPHPANDEGGEREPNEGHIGRQPPVASLQCLYRNEQLGSHVRSQSYAYRG